MLLSRALVFVVTLSGLAAFASELDREIILTPLEGSAPEDREIARWQAQAAPASARAESYEHLGWAFVAKARRTQDAGFYKLAEKTAGVEEERFGPTTGSRLLRGHVLHNLHRFREAEAVARQLVADRGAPPDLALLSDALMEQGKLAETIEMLGRLVALKPGPEAFSRIAHVRWLKGDLAGAEAAMETALRASEPGTESSAWMLVRLSAYALQRGDGARALSLADAATQAAADYAPALLSRGRALLATQDIRGAVAALERATALNPLPEYQWWLSDTLRLGGREQDAVAIEKVLRDRGAANDPRTLALFLATRAEDAARAGRLAHEELGARRDPLTYDALAWALAAAGDLTAAEEMSARARAEGTRDARLFLHAAEIARRRGDPGEAERFYAEARKAAMTLTPSEQALLARNGAPTSPNPTE